MLLCSVCFLFLKFDVLYFHFALLSAANKLMTWKIYTELKKWTSIKFTISRPKWARSRKTKVKIRYFKTFRCPFVCIFCLFVAFKHFISIMIRSLWYFFLYTFIHSDVYISVCAIYAKDLQIWCNANFKLRKRENYFDSNNAVLYLPYLVIIPLFLPGVEQRPSFLIYSSSPVFPVRKAEI